MVKGMSTIKYKNITQYIENIWFYVKIRKFCKKNTTPSKMIISSDWADKVFMIMIWSFYQMEFDYFWSKNKWCFFYAC